MTKDRFSQRAYSLAREAFAAIGVDTEADLQAVAALMAERGRAAR